jgi:hypothetical protein
MPGPSWLAILAGVAVFAPAWIWGFVRPAGWRAWLGRGFIVLVLVVVSAVEPSGERSWADDQSHTISVEPNGTAVAIHDVRHCRYYGPDDYDTYWETRIVDPALIDEVWYVVEPFAAGSPAAHTFLSFGVNDGKGHHRYLAVSVEVRREAEERFSPVAAMFRRFELIYIFADESDVIGLRAVHRQHHVYLYPVKATPAQAQVLFGSMLDRALALKRRPEFYHTLTNSCTTNIADHLRRLWPGSLPRWDLRILLPGNADALALERGLLDCTGTIAEVRQRYDISEVARRVGDASTSFSARIRDGLVRASSTGR